MALEFQITTEQRDLWRDSFSNWHVNNWSDIVKHMREYISGECGSPHYPFGIDSLVDEEWFGDYKLSKATDKLLEINSYGIVTTDAQLGGYCIYSVSSECNDDCDCAISKSNFIKTSQREYITLHIDIDKFQPFIQAIFDDVNEENEGFFIIITINSNYKKISSLEHATRSPRLHSVTHEDIESKNVFNTYLIDTFGVEDVSELRYESLPKYNDPALKWLIPVTVDEYIANKELSGPLDIVECKMEHLFNPTIGKQLPARFVTHCDYWHMFEKVRTHVLENIVTVTIIDPNWMASKPYTVFNAVLDALNI